MSNALDNELLHLAQQTSQILEPPELHGLVCGFAAGGGLEFDLPAFIELAGTDALTTEDALTEFIHACLSQYHYTSEDLEFKPLVCDDEHELSQRLSELSVWCAGFLGGFGAGVTDTDGNSPTLPPDVQEILRDFASISGLSDEVDGDEQDEQSFMEIFEYSRVGSLLVLALMNDDDQDQAESDPGPTH